MTTIAFRKMQGAGNDFVVIDGRKKSVALSPEQLRLLADRRHGIGCDQVIVIEPSEKADVFMRIFNADGSEASSCGNATRCVAWLVMGEEKKTVLRIETRAGILECASAGEKQITVDMGMPRLDWQEIPLAEPADTLKLDLSEGELQGPAAVNIGNPHAVFFVEDIEKVALQILGPKIEHHAMFPEKVNMEIAQIINPRTIRMRVWERGAGETLACGTGACAVLVAAHRRGLAEREAEIILPGGILHIHWLQEAEGGHVMMTGPVALSFEGSITL